MASEQESFELMLETLTSPDNLQRKRAEETYEQTKVNAPPEWLIVNLAQVGQTTQREGAAMMAFTLMRRLLHNDDYQDKVAAMPPAAKQATRDALLAAFINTAISAGRRRACAGCVAALGAIDSSGGRNEWPTLWEQLLATIQNPAADAGLRASCNFVFAEVASVLAENYFAGHLQALTAAFVQCWQDTNEEVIASAFRAFEATVIVLPKPEHQSIMRQGVAPMMAAIGNLIVANRHETVEKVLKHVIEIAGNASNLFLGHLDVVMDGMYNTAAMQTLPAEVRHLAVEAVLVFAEAHKKAFRKMAGFETKFFELMFQYMLNPDFDAAWGVTPDVSDEAPDDDFHCGATAIDRIAVVMRGAKIQELATRHISENIGHQAWQYRVAALTTLTYIMEGCSKQLKEYLPMMINSIILPRFADEHPKVRACAIQAITQAGTDFVPNVMHDHGAQILPGLAQLMATDVQYPRIVALAAAAVEQLLDEIETIEAEDEDKTKPKFVTPYVEPLCKSLVDVMQAHNINFVQQTALHALSTIIQSGGKALVPFAATLAPIFASFLEQPETGDLDHQKLKSRALECITLLGSAVGRECFAPWAEATCTYLNTSLVNGLANDDPRMPYVLRGWTCMVECLGADVMPYIPSVLSKLVELASVDAEPVEVDEEEAQQEKEGVEYVKLCVGTVGNKTVKINTSLIEDKERAVTIILAFVQELAPHLQPYLQKLSEVCAETLTFMGSPEVRDTSAEILAALLPGFKQADPANLTGFVHYITPLLIAAVIDEEEIEVAKTILGTLSTILKESEVAPQEKDMTEFAQVLHQLFTKSLETVNEKAAKMATIQDEEEREEMEEEIDDQEFLMRETAEAVGALVKATPAFFPLFEQHFMPLVGQLLTPNLTPLHFRLGLHCLCDLAEFGGANAVKYVSNMTQAAGHFIGHEDQDVRQASVFLCKVLASLMAQQIPQPHPESIAFVRNAAQSCTTYLNSEASRGDIELAVVANAVSATLEFIELFGSELPAMEMFSACAAHLPCRDDTIEAARVSDRLVKWAHTEGHPIMGDANVRAAVLPKLRVAPYISDASKAALAQLPQ